jgi:hypothetical protein
MKKEVFTLGCCGIDCGLCPRFYTAGNSRCPGCCGDDFEKLHPSCSFITCCVKKKDLEVCAECGDFPCAKFARETGEIDSFVTHRKVMSNQDFIQKNGIERFVEQQEQRISFLKTMLQDYDDGRCKSLFCLSAALLSLDGLNKALMKAEQERIDGAIGGEDKKSRAGLLRRILSLIAEEENVELTLRKGRSK